MRHTHDRHEAAPDAVQGAVGVSGELPRAKNPAAVQLGRLGGLKGGRARADCLTPERRREIARLAARARWETQAE